MVLVQLLVGAEIPHLHGTVLSSSDHVVSSVVYRQSCHRPTVALHLNQRLASVGCPHAHDTLAVTEAGHCVPGVLTEDGSASKLGVDVGHVVSRGSVLIPQAPTCIHRDEEEVKGEEVKS